MSAGILIEITLGLCISLGRRNLRQWNPELPEICEYLTTCGKRDFTDANEDSGRNYPGFSRRAQFNHRSPYKQRTFCGWSQRDTCCWLIEGAIECGSSRSWESQGHRFSARVKRRSTNHKEHSSTNNSILAT